jgi:hypothetical protein
MFILFQLGEPYDYGSKSLIEKKYCQFPFGPSFINQVLCIMGLMPFRQMAKGQLCQGELAPIKWARGMHLAMWTWGR